MSDDYDLDSGPDPATTAAATPEAPDPDDPVYAVGVGPGDLDYLTPRAQQAIEDADVVVGFETVVDLIGAVTDAETLTCGYRDEIETLDRFADRVADGATGTAVLMGDPNHSGYQFLGKVQRALTCPVRVVPGISSLQIAASRARTPMEDSAFVTLHKSGNISPDLSRLRHAVGDRHLLVLPRPFDCMPGDIAADLLETGAQSDLDALVMERLTHDQESISQFMLGDLAEHAGGGREGTPFSDLSVLVVRRE